MADWFDAYVAPPAAPSATPGGGQWFDTFTGISSVPTPAPVPQYKPRH